MPSPYASRLDGLRVEGRRVTAGGSDTAYWVYGSDDAETTLVAVHGFRGEHHGLEPIVAFLSGVHDGTLRVIAPDLPGFGESTPFVGSEHSVPTYAVWLREFCAALGLGDSTVVLGHSFGSIVASAALAGASGGQAMPAARLVLVNPIAAPALSGPRGVLSRLAVFYYWAGAALPEALGEPALKSRVVTRVISEAMAKTRSKHLRSWIHDQHDVFFSRFSDRQVVLEAFRASVSTDVSTYAEGIAQPTLLVAADRDDVTALPAQFALQKRFVNAELDVIRGVGHLIHYEKPREAAEAIDAFLARDASVPLSRDQGAGSRPLDIVLDCRYVRTGRHDGISRFTAGVVSALAAPATSAGHRLTMLVSDSRQLDKLPDLPHVLVSDPTSPLEPLIARRVNRLSPDVVWSPMQTMGTFGRAYRLVLTLHDLIYYTNRTPPPEFNPLIRLLWRGYHLAWWPQRMLLNRADAIVTVSGTTAAEIAAHHLTKRPVTVVSNAADPAPSGLPRRTAPDARDLVYMGSFMPYKNVSALVRALPLLDGYRLHLMSRVTATARQELERLAPEGALVFHDGASDDEYRDVLLGATAVVSASRAEGFGIPLVEGMSLGTPAVVSDIPIFREIGGSAALYFDPESPASIAAAVRRLEEPGEWAARSASSVEQAARFSWDASAAVLLELLERTARGA